MRAPFWTNRTVLSGLYYVALAKGFLRYRDPRRRATDAHRVAFYTRAWREAAESLGASWKPVGANITEIHFHGKSTRVSEAMCEIDGPVTLGILSDKPLTYDLLEGEGLRTPRHARFSFKQIARAVEFLQDIGRDCVVKPASGTGGGRGITTGIRRVSHLARAAAAAAIYCDDLLIEEQIEGDNYRLLYLDGELIDALVRRSPSVVADGRSTIAQLIRRLNQERLASGAGLSQVLLTIDADVYRTLEKQGLSMSSVPPEGQLVTLKTVVNENGGADNSTATHMLCDSIVRDGRRAVEALGVRLAGVDVITTDPSVPLADSGGAVLEVNAPPNLYYHYHKSDGTCPVAVQILQQLLRDHPQAEPTCSMRNEAAAVGEER